MPDPPRKPRRPDPAAVFVDTSGWIAFFSQDDRNHTEADQLVTFAVTTKKRVLTSNLVLAEVQRLLLHRAGIRAARVAIDRIGASPSVAVQYANESHHRRARAWLDELDDQFITLTDAVSFAIMEALRCRVALTFDRDFWTAGFERLQRSTRR